LPRTDLSDASLPAESDESLSATMTEPIEF
jgi:hypothetical protein